jgi:phosphate transport system permease protein
VSRPPIRTGPRRADALGQALTWLSGGALALNLLLILALLAVIAVGGLGAFWQRRVPLLVLDDGTRLLGEIRAHEAAPPPMGGDAAGRIVGPRIQVRVGNRDLGGGADFIWLEESRVKARSWPPAVMLLERLEWGPFYGTPVELRRGDEVLASGPEAVGRALPPLLEEKRRERHENTALERGRIAEVNLTLERLRLERRGVEKTGETPGRTARLADIARRVAAAEEEYRGLETDLVARREKLAAGTLVMEAADGTRKSIQVGQVVRAVRPNTLGLAGGLGLYASRVREFLLDDPRESNTEGGIFPALFGTVMMVLLMTFAVAPLGVLAALYLREYARQGVIVRMVRIAVNNLAGVPSIVFGIFGLGFFVYGVGGTIDRLFYSDALPSPTFGTGGILWASLTLALLTVPVVIVASEEGLASVPRVVREGSLALGATRFETIRRVVLPAAAPGILTGMILAMARAAGEVAPLMIVGMVKLAPELPFDGRFPFFHPERKFMHLGFHIYDVGFQSPNVEATKPMVFATALLLIGLITAMNLAAIALRARLRRRHVSSAV